MYTGKVRYEPKKVSSKEASHLCDFLSLIHRSGEMKDSTPAKDYIQLLN
jgi:hypothetical protein